MDKTRLAHELRGLSELEAEGWLKLAPAALDEADLVFGVTISAAGVDYRLRLVFPAAFPQVPAWVGPADETLRLSSHQFGVGGSLCLEVGPDNWTPAITGVDVLRSAYKLLRTENPQGAGEHGEVESGHRTAAFQIGIETIAVLVEDAVMSRLGQGLLFDPRAVFWWGPGDAFPIFLTDGRTRAEGVQPPPVMDFNPFYPLNVFQTLEPAPTGELTRETLIAAGGFELGAREALREPKRALVLFAGAEPAAFSIDPAGRVVHRPWVRLQPETGARSGAPPERAKSRVAIVGVGSVGSKLAETLTRSGVRKLHLTDGDVLLPANLERNALDWRDVGVRKVEAVRARLEMIVPAVEVQVEASNLNWQGSARVHAAVVENIGGATVIVDATGDPAVSLMLGAVAAAAGNPFVSIEVFEGGLGVLVAACLPARDPVYAQARANFLAWCAEQGGQFPARPAHPYEGHADDGAPIVADDAAVTVAVGHAARAILDILDGRPAPRSRAWQLVGLRDEWVFARYGPYVGVDVGEPAPPPEPASEATEAFIRARLEELFHALAPKC